MALKGATQEHFEVGSAKCNQTKEIAITVSWKSIQDRYKRLQTYCDKGDRIERVMSGVCGEVGETEELLSEIQNDRDDLLQKKDSETCAAKIRDEEKEEVGIGLVKMAGERGRKRRKEVYYEDDNNDYVEEVTPRKARQNEFGEFDTSMARFCAVIAKTESERLSLKRGKQELQRESMRHELKMKDKERESRVQEAEAARKLEMERLEMMLRLARSHKE